jgi:hypothetical protein
MTEQSKLVQALDQNGVRADHYVVMRPMTGRDMMALASSDENLDEVIRRMGAATIEHDFLTADGEPADILDQPWETLKLLLPVWRKSTEVGALPQA